MIQTLSIAGDVFWILGLALMCSMSWNSGKRIGSGVPVPVVWGAGQPLWRVHRLLALWLIPGLAFAAGIWLKLESRASDLDLIAALIVLGVRAGIAPTVAMLHLSQVRRALATLEAEGNLRP